MVYNLRIFNEYHIVHIRQYLYSNRRQCINWKRKALEMAISREEVLTCKSGCKLHRAAFEEAFVEDVRR